MTVYIPHNNVLSDYTALDLRSVKKGKQLNGYNFDFEVDNGLLCCTRVPRGKGVAIDAYGIRWIVVVSGRTLLTGDSLARVFPWVLGTDRPRYTPLVSIGQVTIPEDWTEDDYVLLPAQPELNPIRTLHHQLCGEFFDGLKGTDQPLLQERLRRA